MQAAGSVPLTCIPHPESRVPGSLASLEPFPKPSEAGLSRPGHPTVPQGLLGTHLDPAIISIFDPRADDQLAVGF